MLKAALHSTPPVAPHAPSRNDPHGMGGAANLALGGKLPPSAQRWRAGSPPDRAGCPVHPNATADWLLWQVIDSALPTGGFAHSNGLESAWQHGEVRNRGELQDFVQASLRQIGRATLPFVTAAWNEPDRFAEWDDLFDAFTTNHVANRASRSQGKALLTAIQRIFDLEMRNSESDIEAGVPSAFSAVELKVQPACGHLAPVFGSCLRQLGVSVETTGRSFFFTHLRAVFAAAVRLNIVGPMEAQMLQRRLSCDAEAILVKCEHLSLADIAQTDPLLDLWQGAQDRLYSRLFQS